MLDKREKRGRDQGNQYTDKKVVKASTQAFFNSKDEDKSATKTASVNLVEISESTELINIS